MDPALVSHIVALFEASTLTELSFDHQGTRLHLSRNAPAPVDHPTHGLPTDGIPTFGLAPAPAPHLIRAGLAGTFFHRPAPDQPPFVQAGDLVAEGQTLALIEAMKMLLPVEADRPGRIADILLPDAAPTQPGTPLFRIDPAG